MKRTSLTPLSFLVLGALWLPVASTGRDWNVPGDAPTIQAGIDSAMAGDTVLVAGGTYYEHDIVMKSGVTLRDGSVMGYGTVTVDAQSQGRVFIFENVDQTASIVGFGMTGGRAGEYFPDYLGGAIYCHQSSPHFAACKIYENEADYGGAVYCRDGSEPTFENCLILDNSAGASGGGLACFASSPSLLLTTVSGNTAGGGGGGVHCAAGSSPHLISCTLFGNDGDAMQCWDASSPVLGAVLIAFNAGAALFCDNSCLPDLTCCDLFGNGSDWDGVIAGQSGLSGNIAEDPQFCSTVPHDHQNWMLQSDSPCASAAGCGLIGAWYIGCGTIGARQESWGGVKNLYR